MSGFAIRLHYYTRQPERNFLSHYGSVLGSFYKVGVFFSDLKSQSTLLESYCLTLIFDEIFKQ